MVISLTIQLTISDIPGNLSQIVLTFKSREVPSRKHGCVGLFWLCFRAVWWSFHNYFSRENLFIDICVRIGFPNSISLNKKGQGCSCICKIRIVVFSNARTEYQIWVIKYMWEDRKGWLLKQILMWRSVWKGYTKDTLNFFLNTSKPEPEIEIKKKRYSNKRWSPNIVVKQNLNSVKVQRKKHLDLLSSSKQKPC